MFINMIYYEINDNKRKIKKSEKPKIGKNYDRKESNSLCRKTATKSSLMKKKRKSQNPKKFLNIFKGSYSEGVIPQLTTIS